MGLRGKLRQTFSSSSKKSASTSSASSKNNKNNKNTNSTSNTPSIYPNETHYTDRTDIEYYKPNEIPKSKYRGKVDPAHQASLGAFSLSDAFAATTRRASLALSGTFSPGGTKSQSRVPSRVPSRRPSMAAAVPEAGSNLRIEERAGSGGSEATRERSEDSNNTSSSAGASASAGDGPGSDTASTSLSGPTSTTGTTAPTTAVALTPMTTLTSPSNPKLAGVSSDGGLDLDADVAPSTLLSKQITAHDTPFTAEELEMAMTRATFRDRDGVLHDVHVA
ncbi:hypothetical protein LTR84_012998 [Exophiala bonariae]|uniref:Uncharacterized protein n=1 Tax=Exophiala bonariae TaxID=1690606 RepID=A0AAV9NDQ0_9EURO|nr:hypothetical protein LTR84_012998 [Exophiala bonariae]